MDNPTLPSEQNEPAVVKHHGPTPGPWRVLVGRPEQLDPDWIEVVAGDKDDPIVICGVGTQGPPEVAADARLIAAAPEMLAALLHAQEAMYWHKAENFEEHGMTAGDRVRAAIAKATGAAP